LIIKILTKKFDREGGPVPKTDAETPGQKKALAEDSTKIDAEVLQDVLMSDEEVIDLSNQPTGLLSNVFSQLNSVPQNSFMQTAVIDNQEPPLMVDDLQTTVALAADIFPPP